MRSFTPSTNTVASLKGQPNKLEAENNRLGKRMSGSMRSWKMWP